MNTWILHLQSNEKKVPRITTLKYYPEGWKQQRTRDIIKLKKYSRENFCWERGFYWNKKVINVYNIINVYHSKHMLCHKTQHNFIFRALIHNFARPSLLHAFYFTFVQNLEFKLAGEAHLEVLNEPSPFFLSFTWNIFNRSSNIVQFIREMHEQAQTAIHDSKLIRHHIKAPWLHITSVRMRGWRSLEGFYFLCLPSPHFEWFIRHIPYPFNSCFIMTMEL